MSCRYLSVCVKFLPTPLELTFVRFPFVSCIYVAINNALLLLQLPVDSVSCMAKGRVLGVTFIGAPSAERGLHALAPFGCLTSQAPFTARILAPASWNRCFLSAWFPH